MKTAAPKTSTTAQNLQTKAANQAPFFQPEKSDNVMEAQQKPFFAPQTTPTPFFTKPSIQTKLSIGQPGDKYEQEADQMADQVVQRLAEHDSQSIKPLGLPEQQGKAIQRKPIFESQSKPLLQAKFHANTPANKSIQTKCAECEKEEQLQRKEEGVEEDLQRKPIFESDAEAPELPLQTKLEAPFLQKKCAACAAEEETTGIQRAADSIDTPSASPSLESRLSRSRGGGSPLPESTRSQMEGAFGTDFSGVRVHTDSSAVQMNQELSAQAFTHGSDVYFNAGKYDTGSREGQRLLGHELTHVVQQGKNLIQRDTETVEQSPSQTEASLPAHPSRPPHEIVLLSGGPVSNREDPDHDDNPLNFATSARIRIERLMESAFGDQRMMIPSDRITWVIMRPPYQYRAIEDGRERETYTNQFQNSSLTRLRSDWGRLAGQSGLSGISSGNDAIRIYFVDSSNDFVDFMNNGSPDGERSSIRIGRFEYFGHGVPGTLWFTMGWDHLGSVDRQSFSTDDVSRLDPAAFMTYAQYRSWSCNTATPLGSDPQNFVEAWVNHLGGTFVAAVGRTSYEFILHQPSAEDAVILSTDLYPRDASDRRTAPTIGTPRPAYWTSTTRSESSFPASGVIGDQQYSEMDEGWAHESEFTDADAAQEQFESGPDSAPGEAMSTSISPMETLPGSSTDSTDTNGLVCEAEIVSFDEPGIPGSEICSQEGSGQLAINECLPEDPYTSTSQIQEVSDEEISRAIENGYHQVHFIELDPESLVDIDEQNADWQPFLAEIASRAYHETFDTDSTPGTLAQSYSLVNTVRAHGRGFRIGVVERNGRIYYKIFGQRGAYSGIPGRWYSASNLPRANPVLNSLLNPRAGFASGLRSGSIGIGGLLTVAGTTLDYAIDPNKDLASTDFAADVSLDVLKSAGASAAGAAAGAATTGFLAGGALGATIGSAAPVIGTAIGFVVGVLAAMAIEYFIEDFRVAVKAWLRNRFNIRSSSGGSSTSGSKD